PGRRDRGSASTGVRRAGPRALMGEAIVSPSPVRPPLGKFLRYCYHGSLPAEHHPWVLYDVTCRTWVLRHYARWTMIIGPFFLLYLALMPAAFGIRLYTGVAFSLGLYVMCTVFIL